MSYTKRLMELREQQHAVATQIAVEAEVLARCEYHGEVWNNYGDKESAYKLANYKFTNNQLTEIFTERAEMTDIIKKVIEEAGIGCSRCAKFEAE
jgi:hypothetical protein